MKRIMAFTTHQLRAFMKSTRLFMVSGILLIFITSVDSVSAQSRDRSKPTHLTSSEISGLIGDNIGDSYYYTFAAGPGEVILTLNVEPPQGRTYNLNGVLFELFNEDGRRIALRQKLASRYHDMKPVVERVSFTRRQRVLLRVNIVEQSSGPGKYRLQLGGTVHVGDNVTQPPKGKGIDFGEILRQAANDKNYLECLPKQGTLIVKMKDGSKKIIDLGEAQTVTIVP